MHVEVGNARSDVTVSTAFEKNMAPKFLDKNDLLTLLLEK